MAIEHTVVVGECYRTSTPHIMFERRESNRSHLSTTSSNVQEEEAPDLLNSRQLRHQIARNHIIAFVDNMDHQETRPPDTKDREPSIIESLQNLASCSYLNILFIFVPFGYLANFLNWPVISVFILNYLAIIPLSALVGFGTEEVCVRLGPIWGGVVNTLFGNAVELIIASIALIEEEYRIVQSGMVGSVLSNTMFVLGWAFLIGGIEHRIQSFHAEAAQCAGTLLALSVLSMIIPAAYHGVHASGGQITDGILALSRGTSVILLLVYMLFLLFQLKTHSEFYEHRQNNRDGFVETIGPKHTECGGIVIGKTETLVGSIGGSSRQNDGRCRSMPLMKWWMAVLMLLMVSGMVALSADILVGSVEAVSTKYHISHTFIGMVMLPLAANVAEHIMSVKVAMRDKMDLCITVSIGSAMQMTLFVLPLLIIIAWIWHHPLSLFFDDFQTTTMLISVLVVNYLIMSGRSNWLKGAMLLSSYMIIALAFFLYPTFTESLEK